jgi:predicted ATPase
MAVMARIAELTQQDCQFVIATHSPILLALPGATILQLEEDGALVPTTYDDALPVQLTRDFLAAPQRFLRHLL